SSISASRSRSSERSAETGEISTLREPGRFALRDQDLRDFQAGSQRLLLWLAQVRAVEQVQPVGPESSAHSIAAGTAREWADSTRIEAPAISAPRPPATRSPIESA